MIALRRLGLTAYSETLARMRAHVAERAGNRAAATDELWLTEHQPVFTLGFASRPEHLIDTGAIPVIPTERGGQVTYHGPGQAVAYLLLDLRRRRLGVRELVCRLERGVIDCLAGYGLAGLRRPGAPGIFVQPRISNGDGGPLAKIASIGLKVSGGLTWHGVALNGCMDLNPFSRIDPCGFRGLKMTDICSEVGTDFSTAADVSRTRPGGFAELSERLGAALVEAIDG